MPKFTELVKGRVGTRTWAPASPGCLVNLGALAPPREGSQPPPSGPAAAEAPPRFGLRGGWHPHLHVHTGTRGLGPKLLRPRGVSDFASSTAFLLKVHWSLFHSHPRSASPWPRPPLNSCPRPPGDRVRIWSCILATLVSAGDRRVPRGPRHPGSTRQLAGNTEPSSFTQTC